MIDHVTHLPGGYYDGQLHGKRLGVSSEHLELGASCRAELDQLETFSEVREQHPDPVDLPPGERFIAQVAFQMPPSPRGPVMRRAFNLGWKAAPVKILGIWAFVQPILIGSGMVFLLPQWGINMDPLTSRIAQPSGGLNLEIFFGFEGEGPGELRLTAVDVLGIGGPLGWGPMLHMGLMPIPGVLYCSWMASWWASHRQTS